MDEVQYFGLVKVLYVSIWIDSKSIVWDSSIVFTDNSDLLALGLIKRH